MLTVLNGTSKPAVMEVARFAEVIGGHTVAKDITNGRNVRIDKDVNLRPRQTMILEF